MLIGMIIFIVIAMFLSVALAFVLIKSYRKGYEFGNSLSDQTMDKFKKMSDENVKLKERAVVLESVAIDHYTLVKEISDKKLQAASKDMDEYNEKARKEAFGVYGDMFKDEIKKIESEGESTTFDPKKNAKG